MVRREQHHTKQPQKRTRRGGRMGRFPYPYKKKKIKENQHLPSALLPLHPLEMARREQHHETYETTADEEQESGEGRGELGRFPGAIIPIKR